MSAVAATDPYPFPDDGLCNMLYPTFSESGSYAPGYDRCLQDAVAIASRRGTVRRVCEFHRGQLEQATGYRITPLPNLGQPAEEAARIIADTGA